MCSEEKWYNECERIATTLTDKEKETFDYLKGQDSSFSMEDVEELLGEIEEKDSKIRALLKDKDDT